jgi:iron complex transport system ATP-binding protein
MLTLKNVSAGYGKGDVVKNVSFDVPENSSLAIIGPNGCGKTTLLKTMVNLLPYSGSIEVDGKAVNKMKQKEISRKISLLSQNSAVYFSYSVYDTVMMGRYLHINDGVFGVPSAADKECVVKCLEAVNLLAEKDEEITELSGGQLQRVFLARTLAQEPDIILLDEPTNHLDLKYQIELIQHLRQWSESGGHSVVGVMHDISLAMMLSDNLMVMKDGEIAAMGKTDETITGTLLRDVYDIDVVEFMLDSLSNWESIAPAKCG